MDRVSPLLIISLVALVLALIGLRLRRSAELTKEFVEEFRANFEQLNEPRPAIEACRCGHTIHKHKYCCGPCFDGHCQCFRFSPP